MINDLNLKLKAQKIKLVAFDMDGTMTDGSMIYFSNGEQAKIFNAKDGQGISMLNKAGFITCIITANELPIVHYRAKTLNITKVFSGEKNKLKALDALISEFSLSKDEIAYMGDDLPDLCLIREVGLSCAPKDAVDEVKREVSVVSSFSGGRGAVREFCDFLLKSKGVELF